MKEWFELYSSGNIDSEKIQQLVRQISWGQNVLIITKSKNINETIYYEIDENIAKVVAKFDMRRNPSLIRSKLGKRKS